MLEKSCFLKSLSPHVWVSYQHQMKFQMKIESLQQRIWWRILVCSADLLRFLDHKNPEVEFNLCTRFDQNYGHLNLVLFYLMISKIKRPVSHNIWSSHGAVLHILIRFSSLKKFFFLPCLKKKNPVCLYQRLPSNKRTRAGNATQLCGFPQRRDTLSRGWDWSLLETGSSKKGFISHAADKL